MTSHRNALPPAAKWAFRLSIAIGCLGLLMLIFSPVVGLFSAGGLFAFARGIRKRSFVKRQDIFGSPVLIYVSYGAVASPGRTAHHLRMRRAGLASSN